MASTPEHAEKSPAERLAEKRAQADVVEQGKSEITPLSSPVTPREAAASGQATNEGSVNPTTPEAETTAASNVNIGQGDNANGEADAKENFEEKSFEVQGHKKVTREAADPDKAEEPRDVVQTGGGGTVDAKTGLAPR